jgi:uncharacterized membrane protein YkoI
MDKASHVKDHDKDQTKNHAKDVKHARKADFPDLAKISLQEAIELACSQAPGRAIGAKLDEKHGHLVYKIEIVSDDRNVRKVRIDAITKQLVDMKIKSH